MKKELYRDGSLYLLTNTERRIAESTAELISIRAHTRETQSLIENAKARIAESIALLNRKQPGK